MSAGLTTQKPWQMFAFGGISSVAGAIGTNPMDVLKIRLQIQNELGKHYAKEYKNTIHALIKISRREGFSALLKGLSPACFRQAIYGTLRFGVYGIVKRFFGEEELTYYKKFICGITSGAIASAISTPTDLIKIRMQASFGTRFSRMRFFKNHRFEYKGLIDAIQKILKKEGIVGMYRGVWPTSLRGSLVAAGELSSYDHVKTLLLKYNICEDSVYNHTVASIFAGIFGVIFSNPIDVIKTRVMNQPLDSKGKGLLYKNSFDCFIKIFKTEGVLAFYKGFTPAIVRNVPHVIITFNCLEQLIRLSNFLEKRFEANKMFY